MKSIKIFIIPIGLIGVFVLMAAFVNLYNKKVIRNLQTMEHSKGFAIIELFTSEGCSSCPPADELIEDIQKNNRNEQIYIMAYHVDYWDRQGWKDTFSDPAFSERHRQYGNWLQLHTLYTPQFVINGTSEFVGSNEGAILKTIAKGLDQTPEDRLTLNGKIVGNKFNVKYSGVEDRNSTLVLALIQKSAKSNVRSGENSGKTLSHVQIVRELFQFDIDKNRDLTIDLPSHFDEKTWELIGFLQRKNDGRITAAQKIDL